jgi:hypothetical protein
LVLHEPSVGDPQIRSSASGFGLPGFFLQPQPLRTLDVFTPFSRRSTTPVSAPFTVPPDLTSLTKDQRPKTKRPPSQFGLLLFLAENVVRTMVRWSNHGENLFFFLNVTVPKHIPPHTITEPPPKDRVRVKLNCAFCSPWRRYNFSLPSIEFTQKRLSSVNKIWPHWSSSQFWCSWPNSSRSRYTMASLEPCGFYWYIRL